MKNSIVYCNYYFKILNKNENLNYIVFGLLFVVFVLKAKTEIPYLTEPHKIKPYNKTLSYNVLAKDFKSVNSFLMN